MQETIAHIGSEFECENIDSGEWEQVAPGLYRLKIVMVNVYFVGESADNWILVDAGLGKCAAMIMDVAEDIYGEGAVPRCIVLTHGHFDHIGALEELVKEWNVPVYAHPLELPYLIGLSEYPPADPMVGGGLMALSSFMYPRNPIDLGERVQRFPDDRSVEGMDEWIILETPGHSPGHVSFFRASDRILIAGDAIVTTKQESAFSVMTQKQELHGPPSYFTPDWDAAEQSVKKIAMIKPSIVAAGHGIPMQGDELDEQLKELAEHFRDLAVPHHGRYVDSPAVADIAGVVHVPPAVGPSPKLLTGVAVAAAAGLAVALFMNRKKLLGDSEKVTDDEIRFDRRDVVPPAGYQIPATNSRQAHSLTEGSHRNN
ncbi:MAG TPA: MBL fold metallo-hydrolase [Patescibacteria group bacterium]|nr:MBL fold metallo-hydrolase [Patescibacteria group bacterium]